MKHSPQRLKMEFSYDHASGMYYAHLENGATIPVSPRDVGGKLENALTLFRRAVIDLNSAKFVQVKPDAQPFSYSYDPAKVRKFKRNGEPLIPLPEIELSLDDLEMEF